MHVHAAGTCTLQGDLLYRVYCFNRGVMRVAAAWRFLPIFRKRLYMKAVLPQQFDAFMLFDRTSAVKAFEVAQPKEALARDETYPFRL